MAVGSRLVLLTIALWLGICLLLQLPLKCTALTYEELKDGIFDVSTGAKLKDPVIPQVVQDARNVTVISSGDGKNHISRIILG